MSTPSIAERVRRQTAELTPLSFFLSPPSPSQHPPPRPCASALRSSLAPLSLSVSPPHPPPTCSSSRHTAGCATKPGSTTHRSECPTPTRTRTTFPQSHLATRVRRHQASEHAVSLSPCHLRLPKPHQRGLDAPLSLCQRRALRHKFNRLRGLQTRKRLRASERRISACPATLITTLSTYKPRHNARRHCA
eukprot:393698-Rhodomonas_salina.8